jgi:hypothetical protein
MLRLKWQVVMATLAHPQRNWQPGGGCDNSHQSQLASSKSRLRNDGKISLGINPVD